MHEQWACPTIHAMDFGLGQMAGTGLTQTKKNYVGLRLAQYFLGRFRPSQYLFNIYLFII